MKRRLIISLSILFLLFSIGVILSIIYSSMITHDLKSVINLHRVEIIRQNLVINLQTVQSNLYTTGTVFGKELDVIVDNVAALDNSINGCTQCHHSKEMTQRLNEISAMIGQYEDAISYLITTTANPERIERLKMVAVGIGDMLLQKTQEMAFIADKRLNEKTVKALEAINQSRTILLITLFIAFVIAFGIAITLTRQITRPVSELLKASRVIAAGDIGYQTDYQDNTEFGELARSFNNMSLALKEKQDRTLHYVRQLTGLYNITLHLYRIKDMEDMLRRFPVEVAELIGTKEASIMLYDKKTESFIERYRKGNEEGELLALSAEKIQELFNLSEGEPIISEDPHEINELRPLIRGSEKAIIISWLSGKDKILGLIKVSDKDRTFLEEDVRLLTILSRHVAVALENAELYRSLEKQMVELKKAQEQLIQAAKLAAIGELAANVAHEINNPLTSIIGFVELMKEYDDMELIKNRLEIIEHESIRARDIVRELLNFARKRPLQLSDVDINSLLREVSLLTRAQAKTGRVEIIEDYGDVPKIIGDSNQLKQVFVNIINNAIHAMPDGGKLHIITSQNGNDIVVIFRDTGHGIPADILPRIFEPFFTTKREKGTGLGLSISYRIIEDHGGRIEVESEEGKGTTFIIRLPVINPVFKKRFEHIKTG